MKDTHSVGDKERKPDITGVPSAQFGVQASVTNTAWIVELSTDDTSPSKIGEVLSAVHDKLLRSPWRTTMYSALATYHEIIFFRSTKTTDSSRPIIHVQEGPYSLDSEAAITRLVALQLSSAESLGFSPPIVEGVMLGSLLGSGASGYVFKDANNPNRAVKVFPLSEQGNAAMVNEVTVLKSLVPVGEGNQQCAGIPAVKEVKTVNISRHYSPAFIMEPVVSPFDGKLQFTAKHACQLVNLIKSISDLGIVHRDVRGANLGVYKDVLYLLDWQTACKTNEALPYHGTLACASDSVLTSLFSQAPSYASTPSDDMCSVVRFVFGHLFPIVMKDFPRQLHDGQHDFQAMLNFWNAKCQGESWTTMHSLAERGDCDQLIISFSSLLPN
jgi:hypothetical protein